MGPYLVFISIPTTDLAKETIHQNLQSARDEFKRRYGDVYQDIIFEDSLSFANPPSGCEYDGAWYLGTEIEIMSQCDVVFFYGNWKEDFNCIIARQVCEQYGIPYTEV